MYEISIYFQSSTNTFYYPLLKSVENIFMLAHSTIFHIIPLLLTNYCLRKKRLPFSWISFPWALTQLTIIYPYMYVVYLPQHKYKKWFSKSFLLFLSFPLIPYSERIAFFVLLLFFPSCSTARRPLQQFHSLLFSKQ